MKGKKREGWGIHILLRMPVLILSVFLFFCVADGVMGSIKSDTFDDALFFNEIDDYCSDYNMSAKMYIEKVCFLGCVDRESIKCVGENGEKLVNLDDERFCKFTALNDFGWC